MNLSRKISLSDAPSSEHVISPSCSHPSSLDDLFSGHSAEGEDLSLEWLSIYVEDCLSSTGNCLPPPAAAAASAATTTVLTHKSHPHEKTQNPLNKSSIPAKARTKRRSRFPMLPKAKNTPPTTWSWSWSWYRSNQLMPSGKNCTSDPPLLQQANWLADSELMILPEKNENHEEEREREVGGSNKMVGQARRCSHCLSQRTPQWRTGPQGPKTLCNACGVRYKSGRLLPEYRPAKSPTFVSYKHSNSHKKVMEMRMTSLIPSNSTL